jgi:hypothetical protein
MVVANPITSLKAYLLTVSAITAEVGTRIYGEEIPQDIADIDIPSTIVLDNAGKRDVWGASNMDVSGFRVTTRCYAPTLLEASDLDLLVYAAMKTINRWAAIGYGGLHYATQESGPRMLRDPDTKWPYAVSSYMLMVGEVVNA